MSRKTSNRDPEWRQHFINLCDQRKKGVRDFCGKHLRPSRKIHKSAYYAARIGHRPQKPELRRKFCKTLECSEAEFLGEAVFKGANDAVEMTNPIASSPQRKEDTVSEWERYLRDAPAVQIALSQYLNEYLKRYGQIQLLRMSEPIPLEDIYTAASILNPECLRRWMTIDEIGKMFPNPRSAIHGISLDLNPKRIGTHDGITIANNIQFLNVLGQPGSGKSTLLRKIGLDALLRRANGTTIHDCIPVFIELEKFKSSESLNLRNILRRELRTFGFPDDPEDQEGFATIALKHGKLLVLLDGLDEVPAVRMEHVVEDIKAFRYEHSTNRFILSSRTAFHKTWFHGFTNIAIADFNDAQICNFLHNWFRSQQDRELGTALKFWERLAQPRNSATLELARTPLLLAFICHVYGINRGLPGKRSALYEEAFTILLEKWATEKRVRKDTICEGLTTKWEILLLEQTAGPAFEQDRIFFTQNELITEIERILRGKMNSPKKFQSVEILEAIELQGLLVQRAHNVYSFSHLTIQEFLAARYYFNNRQSTRVVRKYFGDPRWHEVFVLLLEMLDPLKKSEQILLEMSKSLRSGLKEDKDICNLFRWAQDSSAASPGTRKKSVDGLALAFLVVRWEHAITNKPCDYPDYHDYIYDVIRSLDEDSEYAEFLACVVAFVVPDHLNDVDVPLRFICSLRETRLLRASLINAVEVRVKRLQNYLSKQAIPQGFAGFRWPGARKLMETILLVLNPPPGDRFSETEEWKRLVLFAEYDFFVAECRKAAPSISPAAWDKIIANLFSSGVVSSEDV